MSEQEGGGDEDGGEDAAMEDATKRADIAAVYGEMASVLVPRVIPKNSRGEQFRCVRCSLLIFCIYRTQLLTMINLRAGLDELAPRQTGRLAFGQSQARRFKRGAFSLTPSDLTTTFLERSYEHVEFILGDFYGIDMLFFVCIFLRDPG